MSQSLKFAIFTLPWMLLSLGVLAAPEGPADTPYPKRKYHCTLRASLRGNAQNFLYHGKDAWNGVGTLNCDDGTNRNVTVQYASTLPGFGADQSSSLNVAFDISTRTPPKDWRLRAKIKGPARNEFPIQWRAITGLSEVVANVIAGEHEALRSLQEGQLTISGK